MTEAGSGSDELESFRLNWRREVEARGGGVPVPDTSNTAGASGSHKPRAKLPPPAEKVARVEEEAEGRTYHDLENKEEYLTLSKEQDRQKTLPTTEPKSALEHYEQAVTREGQGQLGDSVGLYRKAFKLDSDVQEAYKKKHFPQPPPSVSKPSNPNPSTPSTVPNTAHHSLHGSGSTLNDLIEEFSKVAISEAPPETDLSPPPPCPIARLPEELLVDILTFLAVADVTALPKVALSCKRLAFMVMTEGSIWRDVALGSQHGMAGMTYRYTCSLRRKKPLQFFDAVALPLNLDLTPSVYRDYRSQFRHRPRLRFNGCYISTVNYTRPGGASATRATWSSPVHIVTYYRYLRFFRGGSVISLLTTTEPGDTVHYLAKEHVHQHHTGAMPTVVMKDALMGRWRLSGTERKAVSEDELDFEEQRGPGEYAVEPTDFDELEEEGIVHIETEGVAPKYMYKMQLAFGNAGRKDGTRNNKLAWKGYWNYNRLTDDWGEFALKNDRAFYWSRVKSYTT